MVYTYHPTVVAVDEGVGDPLETMCVKPYVFSQSLRVLGPPG